MASITKLVSTLVFLSLGAFMIQALSEKEIDKLLHEKLEKKIDDKKVVNSLVYFLKTYPFMGYTSLRPKVAEVLSRLEEKRNSGSSRASSVQQGKNVENENRINNNQGGTVYNGCNCSCNIRADYCLKPKCPALPADKKVCAGMPLCDPNCQATTEPQKKITKSKNSDFGIGRALFGGHLKRLTSDEDLQGELVALFGVDNKAYAKLDNATKYKLHSSLEDVLKYTKLMDKVPHDMLIKVDDQKKRSSHRSSHRSSSDSPNNWEKLSSAGSFMSGVGSIAQSITGIFCAILGTCGSSGPSTVINIKELGKVNNTIIGGNIIANCPCNNTCSGSSMKRCSGQCPNNPNCDRWSCVC